MRGLAEVIGMIAETVLRNIVSDSRIVTPETDMDKDAQNYRGEVTKLGGALAKFYRGKKVLGSSILFSVDGKNYLVTKIICLAIV